MKINGAWPTVQFGVWLGMNKPGKTHETCVLDKREHAQFKRLAEKYGGVSAYLRFLIRKELKKLD